MSSQKQVLRQTQATLERLRLSARREHPQISSSFQVNLYLEIDFSGFPGKLLPVTKEVFLCGGVKTVRMSESLKQIAAERTLFSVS